MDFGQAEGAVGCGYAESPAAVAGYGAGGLHRCIGYGLGGKYLEVLLCAVGRFQDGPGSGIWGEAPDEIVNPGCRLVPVYPAGLLEDLGSGAQLAGIDGLLADLPYCSRYDVIKCLDGKTGSQFHQFVMHGSGVVIGQDGNTFLMDYIAGIYLVLEEECGYAGLPVSVYDGPVDGGGTTVLGQKGGVQVEGAQRGHAPDHLGQHTEGHHDLEIGLEGTELLYEQRVLQLFGLEDWYALLYRKLLDGAALQYASMTTDGLIGHGNHTYYIILVAHESAQYMFGKLGGSHEHYPQLLLFHLGYYIEQVWNILFFTVTPQKVQVRHFGTN